MSIEIITRALALADHYGLEADNAQQRKRRLDFYEAGFTPPDVSYERYSEDGEIIHVTGKDHYRKLAIAVLRALDNEVFL